MNIKRKENDEGFTIIEVVLVLAIAGLIFLMVFIALPALQRSQRDTQRKNDLSKVNTALNSYSSNNRGDVPRTAAAWTAFLGNYVSVAGDTFADPSGNTYALSQQAVGYTIPAYSANTSTIYVFNNAKCNGETPVIAITGAGAATSRKVAFATRLEGSGIACENN